MVSLRSLLSALGLCVFSACGTGVGQGSEPPTVPPTADSVNEPPSSATRTTASPTTTKTTTTAVIKPPPDRSLLDDPALFGCSLPDALVNSSHLLAVDVEQPEITRIPAADGQLGPHSDPANTFVWADLADAEVTDVLSVRLNDPRSSFFPDFSDVETITLSREVSGSPLAEVAGTDALVLAGQKYIGTAQEWNVLAALTAAPDGTFSFIGPCGEEFDRQFAAIAAGLQATPDVTFLKQSMQEALTPGRVADLTFLAEPLERRCVDPADVPPSIAPRLRVIALYLAPLDRQNRTIGLRSDAGITALTTTASNDFGGVINAAVVASGSDLDVIATSGATDFEVLATVASETTDTSDGVIVTIAEDSAASVEAATRDRIAEVSGMSVDALLQQRTIRESALTPSTRVPEIEFYRPT